MSETHRAAALDSSVALMRKRSSRTCFESVARHAMAASLLDGRDVQFGTLDEGNDGMIHGASSSRPRIAHLRLSE